jgi:hypothetical protein
MTRGIWMNKWNVIHPAGQSRGRGACPACFLELLFFVFVCFVCCPDASVVSLPRAMAGCSNNSRYASTSSGPYDSLTWSAAPRIVSNSPRLPWFCFFLQSVSQSINQSILWFVLVRARIYCHCRVAWERCSSLQCVNCPCDQTLVGDPSFSLSAHPPWFSFSHRSISQAILLCVCGRVRAISLLPENVINAWECDQCICPCDQPLVGDPCVCWRVYYVAWLGEWFLTRLNSVLVCLCMHGSFLSLFSCANFWWLSLFLCFLIF